MFPPIIKHMPTAISERIVALRMRLSPIGIRLLLAIGAFPPSMGNIEHALGEDPQRTRDTPCDCVHDEPTELQGRWVNPTSIELKFRGEPIETKVTLTFDSGSLVMENQCKFRKTEKIARARAKVSISTGSFVLTDAERAEEAIDLPGAPGPFSCTAAHQVGAYRFFTAKGLLILTFPDKSVRVLSR